MDSNDQDIKAELLAKEVKRRYDLLRMAKGGWGCWTGLEIASFVVICILILLLIFWQIEDKGYLLVILFSMLSCQGSLIGRQIRALIDLIGEDKLLKVSDEKKTG